ncbi:MAG: DUF2157 domain-containing protein [Nannocystaceae bacterium]
MSHARKLVQWRDAGLLDDEAVAAILAFEARQHRRPVGLYVIAGLGALTIALGLLAIIASNWSAIPGGVKIAIDLVIAVGLAAGIVAAHRRGIGWLREALIALDYGFILASIGLLSQVYHLGGATWQAMLLWSGLTALLVTRGESRGLATAWIVGLQVTYGFCLEAMDAGTREYELFAFAVIPAAPLLCLLASTSRLVRARRPAFAAALAAIGWAEVVLLASVSTLAYYASPTYREALGAGLVYGMAIVGGLTALLAARAGALVDETPAAAAPLRLYLVAAVFLGYLPIFAQLRGLGLLGALIFLGEWALVAWYAHRSHQLPLLNLATAVIALRLLIIYFEVFGSLLDTGIGLVSGGLLTIGLAWLWARKRRDFAGEAARTDGAPP